MLARTFTATFVGFQPLQVEVEVDGNRGVPSLVIIGLPSKATDEARQRISSALQNSGSRLRSKRTIVNLAPADVPKHGTSFDLAIAVGIVRMYEEVVAPTDDALFLGELSLKGDTKKIRGCLPLVLAARTWGFRKAFIPRENSREVALVDGIDIYPVSSLQQLLEHLKYGQTLPRMRPQKYETLVRPIATTEITFDDILGQDDTKRALTVAAAGGHSILLSGTPGIGKSMLAQSMAALLPHLTQAEAIEVTHLHSLAGLSSGRLVTTRPFRSPHHTISTAGLIGGGNPPKPGEISLAHHGILFLDEFLEYPRQLLETLRQPLEAKKVVITRATGNIEFPARFTLVAATNPCPCGYRFSSVKACSCLRGAVQKYQQKLSGPLLDRLDLRIQVPEVEAKDYQSQQPLISESVYRMHVEQARKRQQGRFHQLGGKLNGELNSKEVRFYCVLERPAQQLLNQALDQLHLSARSYFKVIKVAQTIADIDDAEQIGKRQMAEALQYR